MIRGGTIRAEPAILAGHKVFISCLHLFIFCFFIYLTLHQNKIKMKKILGLIAVSVIILASCESKKEGTASAEAPKGSGYTLDSSANVDAVKKLNYAFPAGDSTAVYACYGEGAKVHDNLHVVSVQENFRGVNALVSQGLSLKFEKFDAIFEVVNYKPSPDGYTNYVVAWVTMSAKKGNKSVTVSMHQAFAFKDGKIMEEWDYYDSSELMNLMK